MKPQGIRGEIKVKPLTTDAARFNALRAVCVGGRQYRIDGVRIAADGVYLRLDGITDPPTMLSLRQSNIFGNSVNALIFINCDLRKLGHERAIELCVDREISIGDYVLSGGELAATMPAPPP